MHVFLRRFPAPGGLQLFALLCAMMAGTRALHAATITVTSTADSGPGSLRDAIAAASDGDTIQFAAALNGQSITLTSAELAIDKNITINGPGPDQLAVKKSSGTFPHPPCPARPYCQNRRPHDRRQRQPGPRQRRLE